MKHGLGDRRPAFVLREAVAVVVALVAGAAMLAVASGAARAGARRTGSMTNLQQFAAGIGAFGPDNNERIVSFSWVRGVAHQDPDGYTYPPEGSDVQAAADQAVSIIRRLGQRPDVTQVTGWVPHVLYNHLALAEYLGQPLPAAFMVSPSDHVRLAWQRASRVHDQGMAYFAMRNRPSYPSNDNGNKRWPFSSSYEFGPCCISPDRAVGATLTVSQGTAHNVYNVSFQTVLGRRTLSQVVHPANKAMLYETHATDGGTRRYFYAYDQVRTPILMADGSASVRSMSDANPGFDPNSPDSPIPSRFNYAPEASWEPPTLNGSSSQQMIGRVRWTREGLRGRDFGGPEVDE